ncbi:aminotransferase class I/II-fold pyridoxal phosphate-dependent enzyme [Streptomyces sp. NPDC050085]|uniref:aminotransferase class I/II-fold pyridoxal phosphate-dependent enzyme n=1 Tax=Streptomyces sp. NPDC050085 TaxID=3365600 RepID=UPI0037AA80F8
MSVASGTRLRWPEAVVRDRRSADPRVNLSSNELNHPWTAALVGEMVDGFDPAALTPYPVQEPAATAAGRLLGFPAHQLLLSAGSDAAIRLLLTALRGAFPGGLLLQEPNYEAWTQAVDAALWPLRRVASADGSAEGSLAALLDAAAAAEPSLVVVSWPNGPAGYTPEPEHLAHLSALCRSRGHLLVVDGCYAGFAGSPLDLARLADEHCLVLLSWSKMFGFAGGRLAVACGGTDLVHWLRAARQEDHVGALALHALSRTDRVYDRFTHVWQDIATTRESIRLRLAARGHHTPESGGNFLHLPRPTAASAAALTAGLDRSGYRVRDMGLTTGLHHHVRFTVAHGPVGRQFVDCLMRHLAEIGTA